ncbi:hypothetical protein MED297_19842 [Reinekea sp. MED297]|uniref:Uncharacterized protein n=1 Tax=Reinekea blandensis MED297 TaxID=314283 RepID=A4B973_9GAMM|nr:hypothetical protein MED297_19842 [Reinekea sp. MED297] [Reinekea blandensis MED297]
MQIMFSNADIRHNSFLAMRFGDGILPPGIELSEIFCALRPQTTSAVSVNGLYIDGLDTFNISVAPGRTGYRSLFVTARILMCHDQRLCASGMNPILIIVQWRRHLDLSGPSGPITKPLLYKHREMALKFCLLSHSVLH